VHDHAPSPKGLRVQHAHTHVVRGSSGAATIPRLGDRAVKEREPDAHDVARAKELRTIRDAKGDVGPSTPPVELDVQSEC
jgi:hypothetical protein